MDEDKLNGFKLWHLINYLEENLLMKIMNLFEAAVNADKNESDL